MELELEKPFEGRDEVQGSEDETRVGSDAVKGPMRKEARNGRNKAEETGPFRISAR